MNDLKNCFFCISDPDTPFLTELMEELVSENVTLYTIDPDRAFPVGPIPDNSYTITDNMTGVNFARLHDTGYIAYLPEGRTALNGHISDTECVIEGFDEITADFVEKMYQRKRQLPWLITETERTLIRELTLDDIDALFALYEDPDIKRFIPPLLPTKEEERDFQKAYIEKMYGFFGYGFWNIIDKTTGALMGRAGFSNREGFSDPEIGYLLSEPYRKQGIATEVCTALLNYARDILGFTDINAFIRPDNLPSVRFAEKLGFIPTNESVKVDDHTLTKYIKRI
ncbi:MAG: GNAT family N-acetyltransferase [Lachnospiraceae bacterium]|nr:GNAT family N-acetyltransferase [Lachnospiraceae bacterium]